MIKHYLGKHNDVVYMTFCMVGSECNNREEDCSLFFVFIYWMSVGNTRDVITTIANEQKQLKAVKVLIVYDESLICVIKVYVKTWIGRNDLSRLFRQFGVIIIKK